MKPQQLISAGFAITAFAAASLPAVGWTLLGEFVERPAVSVQGSFSETPPLFLAELSERALPETPRRVADRTAHW